jgi:hypothetical protein
MGGGSQPSSTTSTVTQSNLPSYAKPYYKALMERGLTESEQPYEAYNGDRLAGMSDATQSGLNMTSAYANSGSPYLNQGIGTTQATAAGAFNNANTTFGAQQAQQYMSPYMDAVVGKAQQDAVKNAEIEQQQRNLQSARAGSFGGSRAAVQNQMAAGQLQSNLTDIMVKGQQSAFENAQQQFNADQGRNLQALDLARTSGGQLAQMQGQVDQTALQKAQAQLGVGQTQEDYKQQQLDQSYNDFVNQRDSEKQNLQFLSSLLQGVPVSANSDVQSSVGGGQNNMSGLLGSMGGLQALYALGKT